jgi:hypothetical protein
VRHGLALAELVVGIGILGVMLLVLAAMTVSSARSGNQSQHSYEAASTAQNRLEAQLAQSIDVLTVGTALVSQGKMQDDTPYTLATEVYAVDPPAGAGLNTTQVRRVLVTISWTDAQGNHQRQAESCQANIPR